MPTVFIKIKPNGSGYTAEFRVLRAGDSVDADVVTGFDSPTLAELMAEIERRMQVL